MSGGVSQCIERDKTGLKCEVLQQNDYFGRKKIAEDKAGCFRLQLLNYRFSTTAFRLQLYDYSFSTRALRLQFFYYNFLDYSFTTTAYGLQFLTAA
jgi:hypothetical protein